MAPWSPPPTVFSYCPLRFIFSHNAKFSISLLVNAESSVEVTETMVIILQVLSLFLSEGIYSNTVDRDHECFCRNLWLCREQ